jgi:YbbR domain-containing protein
MSASLATARRLLGLLLHNWPQKLGALALAVVMWLFVTTSSVSTTQRSLLVPLTVEGVEASQVAVGVPDVVEVNVSGPSTRIDRLKPENLPATLDLTGLSGEFEATISVQPPRGISLAGTTPSDVIGFLETVTNRSLAVTPALTGEPPAGQVLSVALDPDAVTLTGRSQLLQRVERVVVPVPARPGTHQSRPVALDAAGVPVSDVKLAPDSVTVVVAGRTALVTRTVPWALTTPAGAGLADVVSGQGEVTLAGPADVLAALTEVQGSVQPPTGTPTSGRYTLPVELDLPEGVVALATPTAVLRYAAPSGP